jgi:hypothetical protein
MRVDYFHTGDAKAETIALDRVVPMGVAGKSHAADR